MNVKIFTENIDEKSKNQIYELLKIEVFKNSKVRIMPDVHYGSGCVIGFTADMGDKIIPNVVGVDIGCGMLTVELGDIELNLEKLDAIIKTNIPSGFNVHDTTQPSKIKIEDFICKNELKNTDRTLRQSMGTLGGGNHFIEIDKDDDNNKYLIIHSGSRNLGHQIAFIYQAKAIKQCKDNSALVNETVGRLKAENNQHLIADELAKIFAKMPKIPNELCYLSDVEAQNYLHDMKLAQEWACINRNSIAETILRKLNISNIHFRFFHTVHNYIDENNIIRKGAISARKDEIVLIPINMRDGCILATGKGNNDWNQSAPHGAGRIMSRSEAKEKVNLEEFKTAMQGIYTTTATMATIDEAPLVYKPIQEIIDNIGDTVKIIKILKPIYNFKAC